MIWKRHKEDTREFAVGSRGDKNISGYGRYFTRNVSPLIALPLIRFTSITANQVTWAMLFVGLVGSYLLSLNTYVGYAVGGFLVLFHYILDAVDGEVARARKMPSNRGRFLDLVGDNLVRATIFLGAGIGVFKMTSDPIYLVLAMTASIGFFTSEMSFIASKMVRLEKQVEQVNTYEIKSTPSLFMRLHNIIHWVYRHSFVIFFRTEMYMIIFIVGLLNAFPMWLWFYGIAAPLNGVLRLLSDYFMN